jgi:hypothetical protein
MQTPRVKRAKNSANNERQQAALQKSLFFSMKMRALDDARGAATLGLRRLASHAGKVMEAETAWAS